MATKTDKYELRKKEDNDFYNIDDFIFWVDCYVCVVYQI